MSTRLSASANTVRVRVRSPVPRPRTEISVEGDLGAVAARQFDCGEKPAEPEIGIERQCDAGKIDELCGEQTFRCAAPVREFEQLGGRRRAAPIMAAAFAFGVGIDQRDAGQPPGHAYNQIGIDALDLGQRYDSVGIGVVAQRRGEGRRRAARAR